MEVIELKQQIKTGQFDKWYIFNVQECATARIYIKKIADKGFELEYSDTIYDVYSRLSQRSLIQSRHLFVIINDKEFLKDEKAWDAFKDGRDLKDDIVIFYYTEKDGRLKFWKNFQNRVVDFEKLDERVLVRYIQKEIDLSEENSRLLIELCESDYSRILLELDKLKHYAKITWEKRETRERDGGRYWLNHCFEELIKSGVIYKAPKDAIFDFTNAVLERNPEKTWNLLEQSYAVGEASLALLSVLYDNVKHLLQIQSPGHSGVNGWIAKNLAPFKNNYSNGELVRAMKIIKEASDGIKIGRVADDIAVEQVLVRIM